MKKTTYILVFLFSLSFLTACSNKKVAGKKEDVKTEENKTETVINEEKKTQEEKTGEAKPPVLNWESWNTGYERGKKEKKIVLIDAYTEWCGWCKKMDRDTYANAEVIKKINAHFVPVKFNPELDQKYNLDGREVTGYELLGLLSQNNRTGYPTTFFLVTTKNTIYIEPGYQNAEKFLATLDNMIAQNK